MDERFQGAKAKPQVRHKEWRMMERSNADFNVRVTFCAYRHDALMARSEAYSMYLDWQAIDH